MPLPGAMANLSLFCPCNLTWFGRAPMTPEKSGRPPLSCTNSSALAQSPPGAASMPRHMAEVVISHCSMDLAWLRDELARLEAIGLLQICRVTIYSKCGKPVVNASHSWAVHLLPNVGRNDHTYAHHLAASHGCLLPIIFFVKDRAAVGWSQMKNRLVPLEDMARLVVSAGFACGFRPSDPRLAQFHWSSTVVRFSIGSYKTLSHHQQADLSKQKQQQLCTEWAEHRAAATTPATTPSSGIRHRGEASGWASKEECGRCENVRMPRGLAVDDCAAWRRRSSVSFPAQYPTLAAWLNGSTRLQEDAPVEAVRTLLARPLWPMCYGGSFVARSSEVIKWPHALWRWLATSMSRGDNIAEGHFAERLWGALLTPALTREQEDALLCATEHVRTTGGYYGMLVGCACRALCGRYRAMWLETLPGHETATWRVHWRTEPTEDQQSTAVES